MDNQNHLEELYYRLSITIHTVCYPCILSPCASKIDEMDISICSLCSNYVQIMITEILALHFSSPGIVISSIQVKN